MLVFVSICVILYMYDVIDRVRVSCVSAWFCVLCVFCCWLFCSCSSCINMV